MTDTKARSAPSLIVAADSLTFAVGCRQRRMTRDAGVPPVRAAQQRRAVFQRPTWQVRSRVALPVVRRRHGRSVRLRQGRRALGLIAWPENDSFVTRKPVSIEQSTGAQTV